MYCCPICHNDNQLFLATTLDGRIYCRRCISFIGERADEYSVDNKSSDYEINYSLSREQLDIASKVLEAFKNKKNVLINAVCGAGKTELIFASVSYALSKNMQVGFCVPRRDVIIDLFPRFEKAYKNKKVVAVYGGHNKILQGDIVLITTHQLYRYKNYFDLLIMDEGDAFPYRGNYVLNSFFRNSIRGNYILLSATPLPEMIDEIKQNDGVYLTLKKRYHGHPLPVPEIKIRPFIKYISILYYLRKFLKRNYPVLIFCPLINQCQRLYLYLSKFFSHGDYVHSQRNNREQIIDDFKNGKTKYLVTSTLLERGITIKNIQVIIFDSHHEIFDKRCLIQISGRVGRKIDAYEGEVIYLGDFITKAMEESIYEIKCYNR